MTHSRRKTSLVPFTNSESSKTWKKLASRRLRRRVRLLIMRGWYDIVSKLKNLEVTPSFTDPKEGKIWVNPREDSSRMRK